METEQKHFIEILAGYSFGNCKRAYYFSLAGLKVREISRRISGSIPYYKNDQIKEMIRGFGEALKFEAEVETRRQELIKTKTHYYERTLDSWESDVFTRISSGKGDTWYAVLDTRSEDDHYTSLDFATCCETKEDATRMCALKIRVDQLGIGKYAPHKIVFDMQWEWAKGWQKRETQKRYREKRKKAAREVKI